MCVTIQSSSVVAARPSPIDHNLHVIRVLEVGRKGRSKLLRAHEVCIVMRFMGTVDHSLPLHSHEFIPRIVIEFVSYRYRPSHRPITPFFRRPSSLAFSHATAFMPTSRLVPVLELVLGRRMSGVCCMGMGG